MFNEHSLLALIPARDGSKGLVGKNTMDCAGRPLIEWSISAAQNVNFFDDVLVSTDSKKIADIAINAGASVPFLRPDELAKDSASMLDVVKHTWKNYLDSNGKNFDYIVVLQATSPLRTASHILSAIELFFKKSKSTKDTLASAYEIDKKYGWLMQTENNTSYINFCFDIDTKNPQRQKLKPLYLPNGAIYIMKGSEIDSGFYHNNTIPFIMDIKDSVDIDNIEDFISAENMLLNIK